jgi:hypothetical protein
MSKYSSTKSIFDLMSIKKVIRQKDLEHVLCNWECHGGMMWLGGNRIQQSDVETYLTFDLEVRASHLNAQTYSQYQHFLY